jgi:BirA family biotin operon repressor/biotin-[acetyl-CoA-carboxylase] ligase
VTSTNDIAWAWAEAGCPEGTVIFAEEQVQGRGRFGRRWHCPRGRGLLMSVVFRPADEGCGPAHLTAVGALAAAEGVEAEAGLPAAIRWPNDVTIRGRKIAGVLVERRGAEPDAPCVLGLGLNVNTRAEEFPNGLCELATSLAVEAGHDFGRERVAAAVLGQLGRRWSDTVEGRWSDVASCWRGRCSLLGQVVTVESGGERHRGRVVEIDPLGTLELELAAGERRVFRADRTTLSLSPRQGVESGPATGRPDG